MNTPYTRALAAGIAVLALASAPRAAAQKPAAGRVVLLDRIIAVVNDEVITRRDLDDRIKVVLSQLKQQGTPLPVHDVWIAAICRQHTLPILSRDRHFDSVRRLRRLEW